MNKIKDIVRKAIGLDVDDEEIFPKPSSLPYYSEKVEGYIYGLSTLSSGSSLAPSPYIVNDLFPSSRFCRYCGSLFTEDKFYRGCCQNCGAPRGNK